MEIFHRRERSSLKASLRWLRLDSGQSSASLGASALRTALFLHCSEATLAIGSFLSRRYLRTTPGLAEIPKGVPGRDRARTCQAATLRLLACGLGSHVGCTCDAVSVIGLVCDGHHTQQMAGP